MPHRIILYAHPACPMLLAVRAMLKRAGAEFAYIDVQRDPHARLLLRQINHGSESVPTLIFPDGSILTEPSAGDLKAKLTALGYRVPLTALVYGNAYLLMIVVGVLFALLRMAGAF